MSLKDQHAIVRFQRSSVRALLGLMGNEFPLLSPRTHHAMKSASVFLSVTSFPSSQSFFFVKLILSKEKAEINGHPVLEINSDEHEYVELTCFAISKAVLFYPATQDEGVYMLTGVSEYRQPERGGRADIRGGVMKRLDGGPRGTPRCDLSALLPNLRGSG